MTEPKLLPGMVAEGPTGLKWHYSGPDSDDHLPILGHELPILNIAKALFPLDGVFLDVGAHVGLYSLELAQTASKVVAWEANWKTVGQLEKNAILNGLREKVEVHRFAAWDKAEALGMIDPNKKFAGGSTLCEPYVADKTYVVSADGMPLDVLVDDLDRLDLVKIDVEGAEARVLKGAQRLLARFQPTLLIEMHDVYVGAQNRAEVQEQLAAASYVHGDDIPYGPEGGYHWIARPEKSQEA